MNIRSISNCFRVLSINMANDAHAASSYGHLTNYNFFELLLWFEKNKEPSIYLPSFFFQSSLLFMPQRRIGIFKTNKYSTVELYTSLSRLLCMCPDDFNSPFCSAKKKWSLNNRTHQTQRVNYATGGVDSWKHGEWKLQRIRNDPISNSVFTSIWVSQFRAHIYDNVYLPMD